MQYKTRRLAQDTHAYYFFHFLYLYDKSERSSITQAEIEALLKACGLL